jgi:large subunit ribosomal protein L20
MYKIKTKSSAKKRFRITATGKVKMPQAGKRHGMIKRSNAQIRRQRGMAIMSKPDAKIVKSYMPNSHAKHKKVFKAAKGFYGRKKNTIRTAKQSVEKSFQYSYRDRRQKKRNFRSLWIQRINAGVREQGLTYSKFINGLNKTKISIDRKILADLAYQNPEAFKSIVKKVQSSLN